MRCFYMHALYILMYNIYLYTQQSSALKREAALRTLGQVCASLI